MFTVDGITWDIPCTIERTTEIKPSDISGFLLNKTYFNDVMGTYLSYDITIAAPVNLVGQYYQIYELLSDPAAAHDFTFPHAEEMIQITGRVAQISDVYVRLSDGTPYWRGVRFNVISNAPTKELTLAESIARGLPALPDVSSPVIGDTYTYTANGWVATSTYNDADATGY